MQQSLPLTLWQLLTEAAAAAVERGWQLYLVGGVSAGFALSRR
ncbi:hypothetical protein [Neosynechococcus sphagnicola]|nr:hypothetical protein [Neosynechococcus sphagnicola]